MPDTDLPQVTPLDPAERLIVLKFWCDAFIAAAAGNVDGMEAAQKANMAVENFMARFCPMKEI
jgi:hypothetical protein